MAAVAAGRGLRNWIKGTPISLFSVTHHVTTAEPTALVVEEDIVVRRLVHSGAPFWDIAL